MWSSSQRTVMTGLCQLAGIASELELVLQNGSLRIGAVDCSILPALANQNALRIFIDFGALPPEPEAVLRRLLEINLLMQQQQGERLALDPQNGHVIFAYQLSAPSAKQLWGSLQLVCAEALAWRDHYYLEAGVS